MLPIGYIKVNKILHILGYMCLVFKKIWTNRNTKMTILFSFVQLKSWKPIRTSDVIKAPFQNYKTYFLCVAGSWVIWYCRWYSLVFTILYFEGDYFGSLVLQYKIMNWRYKSALIFLKYLRARKCWLVCCLGVRHNCIFSLLKES